MPLAEGCVCRVLVLCLSLWCSSQTFFHTFWGALQSNAAPDSCLFSGQDDRVESWRPHRVAQGHCDPDQRRYGNFDISALGHPTRAAKDILLLCPCLSNAEWGLQSHWCARFGSSGKGKLHLRKPATKADYYAGQMPRAKCEMYVYF